MRKAFIFASLSVFCFLAAADSEASRPVKRTITGCVTQGKLYSVYKDAAQPAGKSSVRIYPIVVRGKQMTPYEGKKIRVNGYLQPGDRFTPDPATVKVLGICDGATKKAIHEDGW